MVRLIVVGAFVALVISPLAVADDRKSDPPWAKVILSGEIGGTTVGLTDIPINASKVGKASYVRWLGPTPPVAARVSRDTIRHTEGARILTLNWAKGYWLSVWLEPNEEYLAAARKSEKFDMGESEEEQLRILRDWSMLQQAVDLEREVDQQMKQLTKKVRDRAPRRILFEGVVAASEPVRTREADLDAWKKQLRADAQSELASFQALWQHPAILTVGQIDFSDRRQAIPMPDPGKAWVEGQLEPGNYDIGGGKTAAWAIRNGTSPIALVGKGAEGTGDVKGDVRAVGILQFGPDGQLLLEIDELKPLEK